MRLPNALALAVGGGALLLSPAAQVQVAANPRASIELRLPSLLPFSLDQVLRHFNEAFGRQPFRIDEWTFVYSDRENPDETVMVTVADLTTGLAVVLLATGDYGVNYMREFFEARFFLRQETEQLYAFLDRGPGIRAIALDRFKIQMSISHPGNWIVVALEFRPAQIYRPDLAVAPRDAWQLSGKESQEPASPGVSHKYCQATIKSNHHYEHAERI
jgi:hypothetical protein